MTTTDDATDDRGTDNEPAEEERDHRAEALEDIQTVAKAIYMETCKLENPNLDAARVDAHDLIDMIEDYQEVDG